MFDWDHFRHLIDVVPEGLDRHQKKGIVRKEDRENIRKRNKCRLCSAKDKIGLDRNSILHIHHIIPNGTGDIDNLELLCKSCHQAVHSILYVLGKWRFLNVMKGMYW